MGSQWALEQAKYNLVNEYMLVGVTEELEDFVMMLEAALPRFFRGASELYRTGGLRSSRGGPAQSCCDAKVCLLSLIVYWPSVINTHSRQWLM